MIARFLTDPRVLRREFGQHRGGNEVRHVTCVIYVANFVVVQQPPNLTFDE